jgi:transposase-like protein
MAKPKRYSPRFKFECVIEVIKQDSTVEVSRKRNVSSKLLSKWKMQFLESGHKIFEAIPDKENGILKNQIIKLEQLLGKKEVELSFMQNFLSNLDSQHGK